MIGWLEKSVDFPALWLAVLGVRLMTWKSAIWELIALVWTNQISAFDSDFKRYIIKCGTEATRSIKSCTKFEYIWNSLSIREHSKGDLGHDLDQGHYPTEHKHYKDYKRHTQDYKAIHGQSRATFSPRK